LLRALSIARDGVQLVLDRRKTPFKERQSPPPLFPRDTCLGPTFEQALSVAVEAKRVIGIDTGVILSCTGVNYIFLAVVPKAADKPRQILNASRGGESALNNPADKERIRKLYGSMFYLTLTSMACMILDQILAHGVVNISLGSDDVAAFYNQLRVAEKHWLH